MDEARNEGEGAIVTTSTERAFQQRMQEIEGLIHAIEASADPATRARVEELVQRLLELHGAGLERVLELVSETGEPGAAIIDGLGADGLAGSLLLLHGLHPLPFEERVEQALETVRPYLSSHGGDVELLGAADGEVRLRLNGSCQGCPGSAMTLKLAIEEAIYARAPDVTALQVEGVVEEPARPQASFISIGEILGQESSRVGV